MGKQQHPSCLQPATAARSMDRSLVQTCSVASSRTTYITTSEASLPGAQSVRYGSVPSPPWESSKPLLGMRHMF